MARALRPLRQKNMEIQYALQLKEEEVRKMRSGEGKLQATLDNEKQYAERMERQAQNLAQERTMVLEDASRTNHTPRGRSGAVPGAVQRLRPGC